jgi:Tol biopolymer transport system component
MVALDWVGNPLAGKLILIVYGANGNTLVQVDPASGKTTTLFQAPTNSWLSAAIVSPDGQQILMAYAPPPPNGDPNYGYSDLHLLPISGEGSPRPLITRQDPQESYFNPTWAPGGLSIYFTHLFRLDPNSKVSSYQSNIEQASLDGKIKPLIPHALWPALSPDGLKLSYLTTNPTTYDNDLYLANPDGSDPGPILPPESNSPVDDHFFTKDGGQLIFSMVNDLLSPTNSWFEKLFGIEVVSAHSTPSDWYIISTTGGQPKRLTYQNDIGMYADLSPDGQQMAFISATGLYVMNLDGSNLAKLSKQVFIGSVDWIP